MVIFNGVTYTNDDFRSKFRNTAVRLKDDRSVFIAETQGSKALCVDINGQQQWEEMNDAIASTSFTAGYYCLWYGDKLVSVAHARMLPLRQHRQGICGDRVMFRETSNVYEHGPYLSVDEARTFSQTGCAYISLLMDKYPSVKLACELLSDGYLPYIPLTRELLLRRQSGDLVFYGTSVTHENGSFKLHDLSMRDELSQELDKLGIRYD